MAATTWIVFTAYSYRYAPLTPSSAQAPVSSRHYSTHVASRYALRGPLASLPTISFLLSSDSLLCIYEPIFAGMLISM